mgnify:FL=1
MTNMTPTDKKTSPMFNFNSKQLRESLGAFATGVTVVTSIAENSEKVGMTVNSFNSVSLEPPLILWSIGRDANCFEAFMASKSFAVHILNKTQSDISNKFAQTGIDKFEGMDCTNGLNDIPILPDFSVCLQCTTKHLYDGGDHVIVVGEVKSIENRSQEPLIFYKGDYLTI